jgi:antitoxin (DNA-binding transcriptional repressor) of toxin-antitoxin stability system
VRITARDCTSTSALSTGDVAAEESFTVTRDGHRIGELIPIRRRRKFVSRQEFAAMSRNAPISDLDVFRADQDAVADHEESDPYER